MTPDRLDELARMANQSKSFDGLVLYIDTPEALDIFDLALDGMTFREAQEAKGMDANGWLQRYHAQRLEELDYDGATDMDRNRDWGANFNQGNGRSAYDYGRSGPIEPMTPVGKRLHYTGIIIAGLVLALVMFAWMAK